MKKKTFREGRILHDDNNALRIEQRNPKQLNLCVVNKERFLENWNRKERRKDKKIGKRKENKPFLIKNDCGRPKVERREEKEHKGGRAALLIILMPCALQSFEI